MRRNREKSSMGFIVSGGVCAGSTVAPWRYWGNVGQMTSKYFIFQEREDGGRFRLQSSERRTDRPIYDLRCTIYDLRFGRIMRAGSAECGTRNPEREGKRAARRQRCPRLLPLDRKS